MGAFQTLARSVSRWGLPQGHTEGQIKSAIAATMKRIFAVNGNFGKGGYLQLEFDGHQLHLFNRSTNNGSFCLAALLFLGPRLPDSDRSWTAFAEKWTSQKA
jgi:hypothetical protein